MVFDVVYDMIFDVVFHLEIRLIIELFLNNDTRSSYLPKFDGKMYHVGSKLKKSY